jgi:energy-coupling factor transport system substrate-specific component
MNQLRNKKGLTVRDLVTCGIFTALFFIFTMIGGFLLAPNPILTYFMPCAIALLTGPIYLLLMAKAPKHGPVIILGIIMGFMMFITGMYWMWSVFYVLLGLLANLIASVGNFRHKALNKMSFLVFSMNPIGSYMMLWINRKAYFDYLVGKGTETSYVETMGSVAEGWMLPAMILSIILTGLISIYIGEKLLKKQFEKAGILA